ncbi:MAG: hypothetical protein EZS28_022102 [Streblomastix strix]|uniref:Uncharacterized protein n=1 Tax=Streblomastix strix TaxID=222440 RepID=A0A5J4VIG7_9EUKA|nr:MAG: hypothetical protein EZS28_022102 [Streblomastix strix]
MVFFSKIANFGSKILGDVKHAAQWIAPTLNKVLSTVAGPVGMIHPGIGGALGAGANLAEAVDRLYQKRGSNSGGEHIQNEDYQLSIDNENALVYAANNQIIDGQTSDFALKIAQDGLLTVKNLKVLNFDFVAQINQLINEVNQLQSTVGTIDSDIVGVKNDIITIQQELARQQHFRGYYLLNTDIQNLSNSADGDFAFSAESGTVWMYDAAWYNSGQVVPDQITPASDAAPLADSGAGVAGISTEYTRRDHQHSLQISEQIPSRDTGTGAAGTSTAYSRTDHQHILNTDPTVANLPQKDSGTGTAGASNIYASAMHYHPINIDPTVANVPLVNATAAANETSDYYSRNDYVHPQQLTYTCPLTSTMFIKNGAQATDVLLTNVDSKPISDIASDWFVAKTGQPLQFVYGLLRYGGEPPQDDDVESEESDVDDYQTRKQIYSQYVNKSQTETITVQNYVLYAGTPSSFAGVSCGNIQINLAPVSYGEGLRIANTSISNLCAIYIGTSPTNTSGEIAGQWTIIKRLNDSLTICRTADQNVANKGLMVSADGETLTFNGSVIADT